VKQRQTHRQFDFRSRAEAVLRAKQAYDTFMAGPMERLRTNGLTDAVRKEWDELVKGDDFKRLSSEVWAAREAITTPEFWELLERLKSRTDPEALEHAIAFLEADPYFFRSGYIKQKMLRFVRGYDLTEDKARVQDVLLYIVDTHYCAEFREYCRLAAKISDEDFRRELEARLKSGISGRRNRARWMLDCIEGRFTGRWSKG
jgi:hypothetical protein